MSLHLPLLLIIYPPIDGPYENLHHFLRAKVYAVVGHSIDNVLRRILSGRSAGLPVTSGLHAPKIHRRVSLERLSQNNRFLSGQTVSQATVPALNPGRKCKGNSKQTWVRGAFDLCNSLAVCWIAE